MAINIYPEFEIKYTVHAETIIMRLFAEFGETIMKLQSSLGRAKKSTERDRKSVVIRIQAYQMQM